MHFTFSLPQFFPHYLQYETIGYIVPEGAEGLKLFEVEDAEKSDEAENSDENDTPLDL